MKVYGVPFQIAGHIFSSFIYRNPLVARILLSIFFPFLFLFTSLQIVKQNVLTYLNPLSNIPPGNTVVVPLLLLQGGILLFSVKCNGH